MCYDLLYVQVDAWSQNIEASTGVWPWRLWRQIGCDGERQPARARGGASRNVYFFVRTPPATDSDSTMTTQRRGTTQVIVAEENQRLRKHTTIGKPRSRRAWWFNEAIPLLRRSTEKLPRDG